MYRLLFVFPLIFLLFSCPTISALRDGLAGRNLIQLSFFGDHEVDISQLSKVELQGFSIADFQNDLVRKYIRFYLHHRRGDVTKLLRRSSEYLEIIKKILKEQGIPQDLAYLPLIESSFNPRAVSKSYAVGLWQFMYTTGIIYGLEADYWADYRMDVFRSTKAAAYHLKYLYKIFGDWTMVLAAYNAGAGRVERGMKRYKTKSFWKLSKTGHLSEETINYVPKFLALTTIVKNAKKYGFPVYEDKKWDEMVPYELSDATEVELLANSVGMSEKNFRQINLAIKHFTTPPSKLFVVYIPRSRYDFFEQAMKKIPLTERVTFRRYFVKIGDSLTRIGEKFGIPINPIAQINKFRSLHDIRAGEYIIVPIKGLDRAENFDRGSSSLKKSLVSTVKKKEWRGTVAKKVEEDKKNNKELEKQVIDEKKHQKRENSNEFHEFLYLVNPEDTLYLIALRYGLTLEELMGWNGMRSVKHLNPGDFLYLKYLKNSRE